MKATVIDASTVAAALFRETNCGAADAILASGVELHAPDLVYVEVANVIWKRYRRRQIDDTEAIDLLSYALALPLEITPSPQLAEAALKLAMHTGRTAYDCLYVALAVQLSTAVISNDRRLVNALSGGPLKNHVIWLGQPH
jgi:predicted nucleic acid-binding protein